MTLLVLVIMSSTSITVAEHHRRSSNDTDLAALLAFKAQLSDPHGVLGDGWRDNVSFCHWIGVSCSRRRQRVTALVLPDTLLDGSITPHLGNLSFLTVLSHTNTSLTGSIPAELGRLARLRYLDLRRNTLSGSIPSTMGNLTRLQSLIFDRNHLSGKIPSELQNLQNLVHLSLQGNYLSGSIPDLIFNGSSSVLTFINLGNNSLSGPIPSVISSLSMLQVLVLQFNQLSGSLPPTIFNMSRLEELYSAGNNLTGPITFPAGNQSFICPMIRTLGIGGNRFTGRIPPGLTACRKLETLGLCLNLLSGDVPEWLADLSELNFLYLCENELTGSIPAVLSNLTMLTELDLSFCLNVISLSNNQLSGPIPDSIVLMENLQYSSLHGNIMFGPVPTQIGTLQSIVVLYLDDNKFSGSIPNGVGNLTTLQDLRLSYNLLSSSIPASLVNLSNLLRLYISHNNLTGALPSDLSPWRAIAEMGISANNLVGSLPTSWGHLQLLSYLNLSQNTFNDLIPDSFKGLVNLETLDLSHNNLLGGIPKYFANLTFLTSLNLSFNNLQGQIPSGGVFSNITLQSLMGNPRLCGVPRLGFPACLEKSHSTRTKHLLKIVLPAIIAAFGAIVVFLYLLIGKKMKNPDITASFDIADAICHRLVSYQEIVRATENFNEDNLLGVAIKILNMQVERALRSFDAECHVLRMARHRNLIKILNTCSNLDFRALLLQFMPNGNLESYLHSESRPCVGSFLKRMEIMLDVSMAMEYLHHEHHEVVLHCDLKPTNVLFDEEMTAHVADFGIAKMLLGDDNSAVSASMPGTIGYMAPERPLMRKASRKSDVFSFGIMLLEVFTGKRPTDPMFIGGLTLRLWVSQSFPDNLIDVADEHLLQDEETRLCFDYQNISSTSRSNSFLTLIFELGLLCSSESPEQRIAMNDVVSKLKGIKKDYSASMLEMQRPRQY
ncbi:probable LRR receptor-like serine/threonine-protein kinase At3g47570 [Oryza glaberrima]|uniref:probable LRR receptor-like serine/threonine-protein kinase At3g47570 n=1 Tax=Oryza glaberrima TaxID=4538 RepID=UPI00224C0479|nr:probable LRR receptor-like serine/threonine-protein kinase At3g47570 [Oryza glaberrima]